MRQGNAQIGVEFAGYFPAVSLSGLIGYSGNPFATEFGSSNPVWSFGASLAQPLFHGGLTTAHLIARGTPHPAAAHLDLARFAAGRTVDERGVGPFPYLH